MEEYLGKAYLHFCRICVFVHLLRPEFLEDEGLDFLQKSYLSADTVRKAIQITEFYLRHFRRLLWHTTQQSASVINGKGYEKIIEMIKKHPGKTARELAQNLTGYSGAGGKERLLGVLNALIEKSLIKPADEGKTVKYYPAEG